MQLIGIVMISTSLLAANPGAAGLNESAMTAGMPATKNDLAVAMVGAGRVAAVTTYAVDGAPYLSGSSCDSTGVAAAIASLPRGGIVDARGCTSVALSSSLTVGTVNTPVVLLLGTGTVSCSMASGNCIVINGTGSKVLGQGATATIIKPTAAFSSSNDIIHIEPVSGQSSVSGIEVAGFRIDNTNCPGATQLNLLSVRDTSHFHDLDLRFGIGIAIEVTTSSLPGALLSQGVGFDNIYIQTGTGALTNHTVIATGNQLYFGPNVKIIGASATPGEFSGLLIEPDAIAGLGRGNSFFSGSVSGYNYCYLLTAPVSAPVGALSNEIGPANTFENCVTAAGRITGADSSHLATANHVFKNYYAHTTGNIVSIDFGQTNHIEETSNGKAGTFTLTSNSLNNTIVSHLGTGAELSDSGSGNTLVIGISSSTFENLPVSPSGGETEILCSNCIPTTAASCSTATPASCLCKSGRGTMYAKFENFMNNGNNWYCH